MLSSALLYCIVYNVDSPASNTECWNLLRFEWFNTIQYFNFLMKFDINWDRDISINWFLDCLQVEGRTQNTPPLTVRWWPEDGRRQTTDCPCLVEAAGPGRYWGLRSAHLVMAPASHGPPRPLTSTSQKRRKLLVGLVGMRDQVMRNGEIESRREDRSLFAPY